ncbi:hypothetical protein HQ590_05005 [bacterium]|nr:hypothetical protein [bacterium]
MSGRVKGYIGHHINSVKGSPNMAANPTNVRFVRPAEHLFLHNGNWRNVTTGDLITR